MERAVTTETRAKPTDPALIASAVSRLVEPDLPKTAEPQARLTLALALDTESTQELARVLSAVACVRVHKRASSGWMTIAIRSALIKLPREDNKAVILSELEKLCAPGNVIGDTLRLLSRGAESWVDLAVWLYGLRSSAGPYAQVYEQTCKAVRAGVQAGMLCDGGHFVISAAQQVKSMMEQLGEGLAVLGRIATESISGSMPEVIGLVRMARFFLAASPGVDGRVVSELLSVRSLLAEEVLIGALDVIGTRGLKEICALGSARLKAQLGKYANQKLLTVGGESSSSGDEMKSTYAIETEEQKLFPTENVKKKAVVSNLLHLGKDWGTTKDTVDLGQIWKRSVCGVVEVIPGLLTMTGGLEQLVRFTFLVPRECLNLYKAAAVWESDYDETGEVKGQNASKAALLFGMGVMLITRVLCLVGKRFELCEQVLKYHSERCILEKAKDTWLLGVNERLSEFDRMLKALFFACGSLGNNEDENDVKRASEMKKQLMRSMLFGKGTHREPFDIFGAPHLSVGAVLLSIIALSAWHAANETEGNQSSHPFFDIPLSRIDKMLMRLLLHFLMGEKAPHKACGAKMQEEVISHVPIEETGRRAEVLSKHDIEKLEHDMTEIMNRPRDVENEVNIFHREDISEEESLSNGQNGNWYGASASVPGEAQGFVQGHAEYIRSVIAQFGGSQSSSLLGERHAARIIHSPEFAALLLERAASYVAMARSAHGQLVDISHLSIMIRIAGFAIRCLSIILHLVAVCPDSHAESRSQAGSQAKICIDIFLRSTDAHLPEDVLNEFENEDPICATAPKVIRILLRISQASIDDTVALLAIELVTFLCQYGCLSENLSQGAALRSLTTIYEYDSTQLWRPDELSVLLQDDFYKQRFRRLELGGSTHTKFGNPANKYDKKLGVDLDRHNTGKESIVRRKRLTQVFTGLRLSAALCEGGGWIRELHLFVAQRKIKALVPGTTKDEEQHHGSPYKGSIHISHELPQNTSKCEALLEMIGERDILQFLISLSHLILHECDVTKDSTPADNVGQAATALENIGNAANLFRGALRLCYDKQFPEGNVNSDVNLHINLDSIVMSAATRTLELLRVSLSNILKWRSRSVFPDSNTVIFNRLKKIIGNSAQVVSECEIITMAIKPRSKLDRDAESHSRKRIASGRDRMCSRLVMHGMDQLWRRTQVQLNAQCKLLIREVVQLARAIGLPSKNLVQWSTASVETDDTLHFGIGLSHTVEQEFEVDGLRSEENETRACADSEVSNAALEG